ncbi:MAG TPA: glycosyltransferase [Candidatus Kapabacteria bacterium]|jgi:GT2 family glycosyltransferase|nr:glycosyltransferase [Candidatus Kapabacteria bacterium]HRI30485.1 glycosyltransferase [Candidatus Kapabacteria bacterium]HRK58121.1 glycosyltransferase [Candidatus Kapabacteria bacterium]
MSVAAVIVTYNRLDMLKKTIDAVRSQIFRPQYIIVINNGSTDSTPQWLAQQHDIITIHQENVGASGGFVRGIEQAMLYDIQKIWIMDDDVLPDQHCLEQLLALSEKGNKIVAPQRYHGTIPFRPEPVRCNFTNPFKSLWVRHPNDADYRDGVVEVECATFEGPLIDTVVFEKVGLPDKDFFIFADDTEFFERCWRHGLSTLITEHAQLQRMIPFDAHNTPAWKRYYEARNLVVLDRRFGSIAVRNLRPIFYTIKMCMRSKNIDELKAILLGYYHGVIGRLGKR